MIYIIINLGFLKINVFFCITDKVSSIME